MAITVKVSPLTSQASVDDLINIRNAAQQAADKASQSSGTAGNHKNAAEQAKITATEQATLASQRQQAAAQSATAAKGEEQQAGLHKDAAEQAAQAAQEFATDAEGHERAASQKAEFSQEQAENSEASAEQSGRHAAESLKHRQAAADEVLKAMKSAEDAVAVVSGGEASLSPTPGKAPMADAEGKIDVKWLGADVAARIMMSSVRVNDIGVPGSIGYGVGICPTMPEGYSALPGTLVLNTDDYGNYRYQDGSVTVWVPAHYVRIGHPDNPTYAKYGVNSIHTEPIHAFANREDAAAEGYMLPRAFIDGGEVMPGFMHDKYRCSNNYGIASSIKNGKPLSSHSTHNPFSELNGQPSNNYAGAIDAAKTRGEQFFPASRFMRATLATLAEAHAQATTSHNHNKWWDPNGVTNFIKGNNNNALGDTNDPDVTYKPDGFQNCGKTGSGQPFAKTTHNGQNCGIADLNGNMYTIELGLTCVAESKPITGAKQTNPAQLTIDAHGLSAGDQLMVGSVAGMTELNSRIYLVDIVDENTVSLRGVDATEFNPYESGGSATSGTFYVARETARMEEFTGGNTLETDHWGPAGATANMEPIKLNFTTDYPNNGVTQRFGSGPSQVLSDAVAGEGWLRSSLGMPMSDGISTSGSSLFGNDYHYQYIRNELCVLSGVHWRNGSNAGPWAVSLNNYRTNSSNPVGFASASYPVRPSGSEGEL